MVWNASWLETFHEWDRDVCRTLQWRCSNWLYNWKSAGDVVIMAKKGCMPLKKVRVWLEKSLVRCLKQFLVGTWNELLSTKIYTNMLQKRTTWLLKHIDDCSFDFENISVLLKPLADWKAWISQETENMVAKKVIINFREVKLRWKRRLG